jgi:8-oxo-dGTP diphosphatase
MLKLATLVYVKRPGQTLMIHRVKKANDMHAGKWNGLGGKFEPGETPEACAIREIYEESGLRIEQPEWRGLLTFPGFRAGEDWYAFVFVARHFSGTLIDSSEGVLAWIDDDKLLDLPLWEGDRIFIPWLDGNRFFSAKFVYVDGQYVDHDVIFYP